jgi:hypothetical protein
VALAVADAEQSMTYAERSNNTFERIAMRTTHADSLHQVGRWEEAEARFREAEEMEAERQPEYPLLYSLRGFRYCDLLLAATERAAWRRMLNLPCILQPSSLLESCHAVSERAAQTIKIAESNNLLLDIALNRLTLGRAALYAAVLEGLALDQLDPCRESLQQAVNGLRRAGVQDYLPRGASSPAPGCAASPALIQALTARKATSMKPLKSPSAGRCGCIWRTFICIGRGFLACLRTGRQTTRGRPRETTSPRRGG